MLAREALLLTALERLQARAGVRLQSDTSADASLAEDVRVGLKSDTSLMRA